MKSSSYLWEGIYPRFEDVPVDGPGFSGDVWRNATRERTQAVLEKLREGKLYTDKESSLLPFLAATMAATSEKIRILDFGGGMGAGFIYCLNNLVGSDNIEYLVVESENICSQGRELFVNDKRIAFTTDCPGDGSRFDIVHVNSVLQYIDDYAGLLRTLASYGAPFILLARTSSNNMPTYATAQLNVKGSRLAYRFINMQELHCLMKQCGYTPRYCDESEGEYDQSNFPEDHRMRRTRNILYARK